MGDENGATRGDERADLVSLLHAGFDLKTIKERNDKTATGNIVAETWEYQQCNFRVACKYAISCHQTIYYGTLMHIYRVPLTNSSDNGKMLTKNVGNKIVFPKNQCVE